ncbi:hypothetical protein P3T76_000636 [Phytophthora citrophthora]|uniref:Uncharacterized protein n=1 Tax=Phytophthora citrophthora TaxID=4793 RepID=A0AAD9H2F2_9STRA|nr:hypothetical protein P3T76_000636 [Phytophthora citrophthora]
MVFASHAPFLSFNECTFGYSKYHDAHISNQLGTDTPIPDVVTLQTLQDFALWAKTGDPLSYKPANFSNVHDNSLTMTVKYSFGKRWETACWKSFVALGCLHP